MRKTNLISCFFIGWTLCCAHCCNLTTEDFYNELSIKLKQEALNCTRYIPQQWKTWMQEHEPPSDPETVGGVTRDTSQALAGFEYLTRCLHAELAHKNETPPFSLTLHPTIAYNMVLNEVVSLGFDGTLVTKACVFVAMQFCFALVWCRKYSYFMYKYRSKCATNFFFKQN